jgi:hypothetical protein
VKKKPGESAVATHEHWGFRMKNKKSNIIELLTTAKAR